MLLESLNNKRKALVALFFTRTPVKVGETMPGIVASVFVMPIRTLACLGAISKWLTAKPHQANAPRPTAIMMQTTLQTGCNKYAANIMKTV